MTAILNNYRQKQDAAQKASDMLWKAIHGRQDPEIIQKKAIELQKTIALWLKAERHNLSDGKVSDSQKYDTVVSTIEWWSGLCMAEICYTYSRKSAVPRIRDIVRHSGSDINNWKSAQQVDSAEASTIAVPPSDPSGSPR